MTLIKSELERKDISLGDKKAHVQLEKNSFNGFVVYERYSNGNVKTEYEWRNGREHGFQVEYYENGQVKYYQQMNDYEEIGPAMAYWEDGRIRHEEFQENGKWATRQYDEVGNVIYEFKNGVVLGELQDYTK